MFRYGAKKGLLLSFRNGMFQFSIHWMSIIGGACYITSFILFLLLISKYDLSRINPILVGMTYLCSIAAAVFILKESVTAIHMAGLVFILAGVFLIIKGSI